MKDKKVGPALRALGEACVKINWSSLTSLALSPRVISASTHVFLSCECVSGAKALAEAQIYSPFTPLTLPAPGPFSGMGLPPKKKKMAW